MLGLTLKLPGASLRTAQAGAGSAAPAPPPPPPPPPTPPPPPSAAPVITALVIEGDSITSTTPNQSGNRSNFYGYVWAAAHPDLSVRVAGQASRTVGGPAINGDGADTGSPAGNTLLGQRDADLAVAPQLLTVMIGANDLGTFQTATYIQHLIDWAAPLRAAGVRIAWSPPTPYRDAAPRHVNYATYTTRRAALLATCRDPATWGQWADYYLPMGEHPDFADPALIATAYADEVHPSGFDATPAGSGGQIRLHAVFDAALTTLLDAKRAEATTIYAAAWPASETNLAPATEIVRRLIVRGVAHAGLASGASATGAQLRLNGGGWGSSVGRIYNGDVIDLRLTTSPDGATAVGVALRIGSETRTLTYRTVAQVTPVAYRHGGVVNAQPAAATHGFTALPFAAPGVGVIAISAGGLPTGVTVGGVAATRQVGQAADAALSIWTVPIAMAGARDVTVAFAGFKGQSTLSWGVVTGADAAPTQVDGGAPGYQSQPFETGALTVPASGIALAFFAEYGGAGIAPATANAGTTLIDEANGIFQSETVGLAVAKRLTSGTASFGYAFGKWALGALVFKATGT